MLRIFRKWNAIAVLSIALVACGQPPTSRVVKEGGCSPSHSSYLKQAPEVDGRITYCEQGDASIGELTTTSYPKGTQSIDVMLAGYPETDGIQILAVATDGSVTIPLKVANIGDSWKKITLDVPADLHSHAFSLKLVDKATGTFGWAGLGNAPPTDIASGILTHLLPLALAILTAHLWLVFAGCALPANWNPTERSLCAILTLGTACCCVIGSYVASPTFGTIIAYVAFAMPMLALRPLMKDRHAFTVQLHTLNRLLLPSLLLTGLIIWIGLYPFSWDGQDWQTPANRWRSLPMDSWLPLIFADMISEGRLDVPMIGDWLSSDRPPLQSGLYLVFVHSWLPKGGLTYQALSTWAQSLLFVPLLALVSDLPRRSQRVAVLFSIALSPLVLLNGLFVWPKLLAATFCAIFHIALFGYSGVARHTRWWMGGVAAALAMLSHGGALFALVGSTGAVLVLRRREALPLLLRTGALSVVLYAPWIVYQHFIDPPGDRLLKWHFAGYIPVTQESFFSILRSAYADLTFSQWIAGRVSNLNSILHGSFSFFGDALMLLENRTPTRIATIVENSFFYGAYSMWFASPLLLLPCLAYAFATRTQSRISRFPSDLAMSAALSFLFWIAAIYEPGQTVIHQGAYFSFVGSMLLVLLVLARYFPPVLYAVAALNSGIAAFTYAFDVSHHGTSLVIYTVATLVLTVGLVVACGLASGDTSEDRSK
ncbi:hypothetical protein LMG31884_37770 [Xanthomonas hydrangeae]|uniref:hypothetical protein n=1 Tax=Xanthomonas hydrangeae TaxID=2775159 RepID=UPI001AF2FA30|nr:hypothetical protein LMG31884_37770 [Xanthomonas hydrangeae]CAD7724992.1 hypothetical protein LMG31884_37770 [Xanthomonas hydrangeae]CAD7741284.1 hypothetical protein LMG31887_37680 [Xanthomonas hydrangeae]CAD7741288.1 hypothetical protein LMG31887_37680 [Xanthomonas hydrangeae]